MRWCLGPVDDSLMRTLGPPDDAALAGGAAQPGGGAGLYCTVLYCTVLYCTVPGGGAGLARHAELVTPVVIIINML